MNRNRILMGSAISLAAIAVAIDHTRHRLPEPVSPGVSQEMIHEAPCTLENPCALGNPCSLGGNTPCSL
jgi:hypothetical protein